MVRNRVLVTLLPGALGVPACAQNAATPQTTRATAQSTAAQVGKLVWLKNLVSIYFNQLQQAGNPAKEAPEQARLWFFLWQLVH